MAENTNSTVEALRTELATLRSQLENIVKTIENKKSDLTSDMASRIAHEVEHYRQSAVQRAGQIRNAGEIGLEEVGRHVRQNPIASLAIAFGTGWLLSCMLRRMR